MSNSLSDLQLSGDLQLELDRHLIQMKCEKQTIQLTFSSFTALRKFIYFNRQFNRKVFPFFNQKWMHALKFRYYLGVFFIGESGPDLKSTWLGHYLGLDQSVIHLNQLVRYFTKSFLSVGNR
jgi:hypothetical protein